MKQADHPKPGRHGEAHIAHPSYLEQIAKSIRGADLATGAHEPPPAIDQFQLNAIPILDVCRHQGQAEDQRRNAFPDPGQSESSSRISFLYLGSFIALGVIRRVGFTGPMAWRARLRAFRAGSSLISNGLGFFIVARHGGLPRKPGLDACFPWYLQC